jgi:thiol:disulfide interchange protein
LSAGASSGDLGRVALGMAVFGLTMAIPFVFLSLVPDRVKAMPKSGEWMHTLKVTLGFVEVAAALKFLSNVDLVWNWGWLSRELFLFLWMGIFVVAALYLLGLVHLEGESRREISPGRMIAALSFFLFSIYCGYGALGNSLDSVMSALIPPYSNREPGAISQAEGGAAATARGHVIVKDDYAAAIAQAKREKKLVLVNFTGFT